MPTSPPDFNITTSDSSQTVMQGKTIRTTVNVAGVSGNQENVTLSADAGSSGIQCSFSQPTSAPDFSSTLTMTVPADLTTNSYSVTILATNGRVTHSVAYTVSVLRTQILVHGQVILTGGLRTMAQIQFTDQQTGQTFPIAMGDPNYSIMLENGYSYTISGTSKDILNQVQTLSWSTIIYVNAPVGIASMCLDTLHH
jgi:hypothetical protein